MPKGIDINVKMAGYVEVRGQIAQFKNELPGVVEGISYTAAKMTAEKARPDVPVDSGRAAQSVQAYMTGGQAMVQGGKGVDYYAWLEYGGASGRNLSNRRATVPEGRYIYPAYQQVVTDIERHMNAELERLSSTIFRG